MNARNLIKKIAKYKRSYGETQSIIVLDNEGVRYNIIGTESTKDAFILKIDSNVKEPIKCPACKKLAHWYEEFGTYVCTSCERSIESKSGSQNSLEFGRKKVRVKPEPIELDGTKFPSGKLVYGRKS